MLRCVALLLAPTLACSFGLGATTPIGRHAVALRAGHLVASAFDDLTLDEKVAMVRVAQCLDSRAEDEAGAFAAGPVSKRPEWASPTNETWTEVRSSYPVLKDLSDETLAAAREECLQKQQTVAPTSGDGGLSSGAVPLTFLAIIAAYGVYVSIPG